MGDDLLDKAEDKALKDEKVVKSVETEQAEEFVLSYLEKTPTSFEEIKKLANLHEKLISGGK